MPIYVWYPILIGLTVGFSFMSIPPLTGQFMALFGVGYDGLAFLLSGILWSHSLLQIPLGLLIDRIGAYRSVALAVAIGMVGNLLPLADGANLALAVFSRFLLGVCTGLVFLCMLRIIAILAPAEDMAKAQGYYGGAFGFGTMLPYLVLPHFGEQAWKYSYMLNAAMYAATLLCVLLLPAQKLRRVAPTGQSRFPEVLRYVFRCREIWALGLFHGITYGTLNNLGQWFPSILSDLSGADAASYALVTTAILFLGSSSRFISGQFLRFFSHSTLLGLVSVLVFILYSVIALTGNADCALGAGMVLAVVSGMNYGAVFSLGSVVTAAAYTGTALGLMNTIANTVNIGITLLFGNVREATGSFDCAMGLVGAAGLAIWLVYRGTVSSIAAYRAKS